MFPFSSLTGPASSSKGPIIAHFCSTCNGLEIGIISSVFSMYPMYFHEISLFEGHAHFLFVRPATWERTGKRTLPLYTGLFPTYALVAVMQSHKIPDGLQPSDSSPFARNKNVAGE